MKKTSRLAVIGLVIGMTTIGAAKETISVRVTPEMAFAPSDVFIRASVAPDADNRAIEIVADSDDFYRASTVPLEGDRAPFTTTFSFRNLPSGTYEITATLIGAGERRRAIAHARVNLIGAE